MEKWNTSYLGLYNFNCKGAFVVSNFTSSKFLIMVSL